MIPMVKATTPVQLISVGRLTSRSASASLRSLERQRGAGDRCGRKDEVVEEHLYTTKVERQLEAVERDRPYVLQHPV